MEIIATISGTVEHGAKLGRELGFPTANIGLTQEDVDILNGVYLCRVGQWWGLASWGVNATVSSAGARKFEVHIIDYIGEELYGKTLNVELVEYIRAQEKFNSVEELKVAIEEDMIIARKLIEKYKSEI